MCCCCFGLIFVRLVTFNTREAIGSYAENQRITAVRKVYQRGVVNPMLSIELLWKEYSAFEHVRMITVISLCVQLMPVDVYVRDRNRRVKQILDFLLWIF